MRKQEEKKTSEGTIDYREMPRLRKNISLR